MGIRNYLIEGGSGTGKTTLAEELERRGHHVIHGDRQFAYYGDPETGEPVDWPAFDTEAEKIAWGYDRWIWPVDKVRALIADRRQPTTFFCGHSSNSRHFIGLFDRVYLLDVDRDTLTRRLTGRRDDEFGGRAVEQELVLRLHESKSDVPHDAIRIDATRPVAEIADDILARCEALRP